MFIAIFRKMNRACVRADLIISKRFHKKTKHFYSSLNQPNAHTPVLNQLVMLSRPRREAVVGPLSEGHLNSLIKTYSSLYLVNPPSPTDPLLACPPLTGRGRSLAVAEWTGTHGWIRALPHDKATARLEMRNGERAFWEKP